MSTLDDLKARINHNGRATTAPTTQAPPMKYCRPLSGRSDVWLMPCHEQPACSPDEVSRAITTKRGASVLVVCAAGSHWAAGLNRAAKDSPGLALHTVHAAGQPANDGAITVTEDQIRRATQVSQTSGISPGRTNAMLVAALLGPLETLTWQRTSIVLILG